MNRKCSFFEIWHPSNSRTPSWNMFIILVSFDLCLISLVSFYCCFKNAQGEYIWPKVPQETRSFVKTGIFQVLMSSNPQVTSMAGRLLGAVGTVETACNMWESIITNLSSILKDGSDPTKIAVLNALSYICEDSVCCNILPKSTVSFPPYLLEFSVYLSVNISDWLSIPGCVSR